MFHYPPSATVNSDEMLPLLGSFWTEFYDDGGQLRDLFKAVGTLQWQLLRDTQETADCGQRTAIPPWHRQQWLRLVLRDSQLVSRGEPFRFGTDLQFGTTAGREHYFGEYKQDYAAYPCPPGLVQAAAAVNRIQDASAWFTAGTDFRIDTERQLILFRQDPLLNPLCAKEDVQFEGSTVRQTILWLFQADIDKQYIQHHLGYLFRIWRQSSFRYRDLLNAVTDAITGGGTRRCVERLITAATQATFGNAGEYVIDSYPDTEKLLCVTNQRVHTFPADTELRVSVGDELVPGQPLSDIAELVDFRQGVVPDWLPGLTVGRQFLPDSIPGELYFQNADVPLTLETVDGVPQARFELHGDATTIAAFWSLVDEMGVNSGKTLAMYLDRRDSPTTAPALEFLPPTINPAEFLVANIWRENIWLLRLKQTTLSDWLPLPWGQLFRQLLPPHTTVLLFVELATLDDFDYGYVTDILDAEPLASDTIEDTAIGGVDELLRPITVQGDCN